MELVGEEEVIKSSFSSDVSELTHLCRENAEALRSDESAEGQRLSAAFLAIIDHIKTILPSLDKIRAVAPLYDFSPETPGNGYRSFVNIVETFVAHALKLAREVAAARNNLFFRKSGYMKEVEACSHVLASLGTCLEHLVTYIDLSETGNLFPDDKHSPAELLAKTTNINQICFYGRCLGFQFCESMRKALQFICITMASYSEAYYNSGGLISKATNSVYTGSKYLIDPELRARRIVNIAQYSDVEFCKAFWQLAETDLMQKLPSLVTPSVAINQEISIPPQSFTITGIDGSDVIVPAPSSHIGPKPVLVRLISANHREGMLGKTTDSNSLPPSPYLLVHCHGGGFVAQSSRSHECYLRDWANWLNVPIISVDYSLAPDAPFPRALEETLYAYCWARKNCNMLGSTGQKVILVGDSAGANLNLGVALKCIEMGLPRPHGMFLAYVPVLVAFIPSPARLLCFMDPLLPFGFMMRCLKAYAGHLSIDTKKDEQKSEENIDDLPYFEGEIPAKNSKADEEMKGQLEDESLTELPLRSPSKFSDHESDSMTTVSLVSPPALQPENSAAARSRKYVAQFLDRYVQNDKIKDDEEQDVLFEAPQAENSVPPSPTLVERFSSMASSFTGHFSVSGSSLSREPSLEAACGSPALPLDPSELDQMLDKDPTEEFKFTVPKDPYLSPYFASDKVLKQLPPIKILSLQLDPCLDDCVMFAKRLKALGNDVQLDILKNLPHGFLNFSLISKEAHEGSKLCVERIKALLGFDEVDN
ncbi:hormone-sensitive lipase [Cloeon dipterum]|uniref:hormone-sensitive lipase n=1 Tax=Cloeon dipterum TaxID=197152 RepID=UPI00321F76A4